MAHLLCPSKLLVDKSDGIITLLIDNSYWCLVTVVCIIHVD